MSALCIDFYKTISKLRSPDGCPWDREQTIDSLRQFLIEEAYEAVHAAGKLADNKKNSYQDYCDELGDVLLQVFLNASIAEELGQFTIEDVFESINKKMIRRHPHVFLEKNNEITTSEVLSQWGEIKKQERGESTKKREYLLAKASKKSSLPTIAFGSEISRRAMSLGFSWPILRDVFRDLESEIHELSHEVFSSEPDIRKIEDEAGDVVYSLCNVFNFLKQNTEEGKSLDLDIAARGSFDKFLLRFETMEKILEEKGIILTEELARSYSVEVWEDLWKQAKTRLAKR